MTSSWYAAVNCMSCAIAQVQGHTKASALLLSTQPLIQLPHFLLCKLFQHRKLYWCPDTRFSSPRPLGWPWRTIQQALPQTLLPTTKRIHRIRRSWWLPTMVLPRKVASISCKRHGSKLTRTHGLMRKRNWSQLDMRTMNTLRSILTLMSLHALRREGFASWISLPNYDYK